MLRSGASAQDREEFLREAETMLALGSTDNVVGLVGVAVRQRPWLAVLELCQYGDLADVLHALDRKKMQLTLHEMLRCAAWPALCELGLSPSLDLLPWSDAQKNACRERASEREREREERERREREREREERAREREKDSHTYPHAHL
jgi:hypothetical protein